MSRFWYPSGFRCRNIDGESENKLMNSTPFFLSHLENFLFFFFFFCFSSLNFCQQRACEGDWVQFLRVFPAQWVHKCLEVNTNVSNITQLTFAFMLLTVFWCQENENIMFFSCASKCKCFYCLRVYGQVKKNKFVVLSVPKYFTQSCKCEPRGCCGKLRRWEPRMLKELRQFKGSSETISTIRKIEKRKQSFWI